MYYTRPRANIPEKSNHKVANGYEREGHAKLKTKRQRLYHVSRLISKKEQQRKKHLGMLV
jgi:hypothetical protein